MIQILWKEKLGWDDELPIRLREEWREMYADLKMLPSMTVSRYLGTSLDDASSSLQLHCFCDASTKAYAAVIYLRYVNSNVCKSSLFIAKTRVTPAKRVTLPRFELLRQNLPTVL